MEKLTEQKWQLPKDWFKVKKLPWGVLFSIDYSVSLYRK